MNDEERRAILWLVEKLKGVENEACRLNCAETEVGETGYTVQDLIQILYEQLEESTR